MQVKQKNTNGNKVTIELEIGNWFGAQVLVKCSECCRILFVKSLYTLQSILYNGFSLVRGRRQVNAVPHKFHGVFFLFALCIIVHLFVIMGTGNNSNSLGLLHFHPNIPHGIGWLKLNVMR